MGYRDARQSTSHARHQVSSTKNAGRSGRRWRALVKLVYARRSTCCRCGQSIDYSLSYRDAYGNENPNAKSVDHFPLPRSTHPQLSEDPANLAAAHLRCNKNAGDRNPVPGLGIQSENW